MCLGRSGGGHVASKRYTCRTLRTDSVGGFTGAHVCTVYICLDCRATCKRLANNAAANPCLHDS